MSKFTDSDFIFGTFTMNFFTSCFSQPSIRLLSILAVLIFTGCTQDSQHKISKSDRTAGTKQHIAESANDVVFIFNQLAGLTEENGISRRDPSDIIRHDGKYYVWYSKSVSGFSGYDATVWYATSTDGQTWTEQAEAIARGETGSWDESSVFTPNILIAEGKFYLFYTAVKPTPGNPNNQFENNLTDDVTAIGVVVAEHPAGPFKRVSSEPVITHNGSDNEAFDSYRVDDAALVVRNNEYWMYYKGRSIKYGKKGPKNTKMGVAIATSPAGPYKKLAENPIIAGGHEVMVWPYKDGVMTLVSNVGNIGQTLQYAKDGINFEPFVQLPDDYPHAPGIYRSDNFEPGASLSETFWGISMSYGKRREGEWPHLLRYDTRLPEADVAVK